LPTLANCFLLHLLGLGQVLFPSPLSGLINLLSFSDNLIHFDRALDGSVDSDCRGHDENWKMTKFKEEVDLAHLKSKCFPRSRYTSRAVKMCDLLMIIQYNRSS
jgi:hypothetical protein